MAQEAEHAARAGSSHRKKVVVIGAGLAGLVTVKELLEEGHEVRCFERARDIGGVFSKHAEHRAYDSTNLTVSNYFMAYSDFMPVDEPVRFWSRDEYNAYLNRYADHFGLREHIALQTEVRSAARLPDGRWRVEAVGPQGEAIVEEGDRLAICSGQFQSAVIPSLPGLDRFGGQVLHSEKFKTSADLEPLRGKRVLCVGMGESAADIVAEVAAVAASSVLSVRRYHVVSPRFWTSPFRSKDGSPPKEHPIDVGQTRFWHTLPAADKAQLIRNASRFMVHSPDDAERLRAEHLLKAADEPGSVVTKTGRIFQAMAEHGLRLKVGRIQEISESAVTFEDGTQETIDGIVLCTGYRFSLPYLPPEVRIEDVRSCFKQMIHPAVGDSLAFIGFVRPSQGGVPLMAELQARYFALLCSGKRSLPTDLEGIARRDEEKWKAEFYETPHVAGLVNGLRYNEELAELIGCRPPVPTFFTAPQTFLRYWFHHVWPSQYRLVGPGARPEAAAHLQQVGSIFDGAPKPVWLQQLGIFAFLRLRDGVWAKGKNRVRPLLS